MEGGETYMANDFTTYGSYGSYSSSPQIDPAALMPVLIIAGVIMLFFIICEWRIYQKAGYGGWEILIPIYNAYVFFKITWGSGWYMFLMCIPLVNVVIGIITMFKLARVFGKGAGFGFGLLFLEPIFLAILAFGNCDYEGEGGAY